MTTPQKKEYKNPPCGNCHEDHEGRTLCHPDFMTQTKEKEWEEDFDEFYWNDKISAVSIKNFIHTLLSSQKESWKKKLVERLERKKGKKSAFNETLKVKDETDGWNEALKSAIKIIKES